MIFPSPSLSLPTMGFLQFYLFFILAAAAAAAAADAVIQPCHPADRQALTDFAGNLISGGASLLSLWSSDVPCCSWDGVICSLNSTRILELHLSSRLLRGPISSSLANVSYLRVLDVSDNQLFGSIPAEFSKLSSLEIVNFSSNGLSGPITIFSALPALKSLHLSSNEFNGSLFNLSSSPNLVHLNVSNNSIAGTIGSDICLGSKTIEFLDLSDNLIYGELPESEGIVDIPICRDSLRHLDVSMNLFSGNLKECLFELVNLEKLCVSSNEFSGQFGSKLGKLVKLRTLDLSENQFSGPIPDVFANLTSLEHFVAYSNKFSGELPPSISQCLLLQDLSLRNNSLSGVIDALNFSRMANLSFVDFATNNFSGPLPSSLSHCRRLRTLSVAKNNLSGEIPEEYRKLVSLAFISLSNNSFSNISGALTVLRECKNLTTIVLTRNFHGEEVPRLNSEGFDSLRILALGNCALRGRIPEWLTACKKLEVLDLSWNNLIGIIPSWIGQFDNLFYLDISNNSLVGEIPKSLTQLRSLTSSHRLPTGTLNGVPLYVKRNQSIHGLQYKQLSSFPPSLYLNDNQLKGTIWPEFGELKELHVLDLSNNSISGSIPETLSRMENLEVLDLSYNNLSGTIPKSLCNLTFLSMFSVANNDLQGMIPTGGQFFSFSNSSFEGNPGLCRTATSCGNDTQAVYKSARTSSRSSNKIGKSSILGITVSMGIGITVLLAIVLFNMSKREVKDPPEEEDVENSSHRLSDSLSSRLVLFFPNSECKELTMCDILKSTNNFDQANIIGCGGFGLVYKAYLPDGTKAAIKKLSGDCGQMDREFRAEVESLLRAQHRNLVSLKGYCIHGNDKLLIYSYMENGSLDYWLHERVDGGSLLGWQARLKIAQGSARGLGYLHKVCVPNIIHRDVKSSNILLDETFEAHLADFGLSRLIRPYDTHVTTDLVGTLGYIPPEYSQTLTATLKGDVFSFGVVLLELLTGRRPFDVCKAKGCKDLVSWVFQMKSEKKEEMIYDPVIWNKAYEKQLLKFLEIACKCISKEPRHRPSIDQVVSWLDSLNPDPSLSEFPHLTGI